MHRPLCRGQSGSDSEGGQSGAAESVLGRARRSPGLGPLSLRPLAAAADPVRGPPEARRPQVPLTLREPFQAEIEAAPVHLVLESRYRRVEACPAQRPGTARCAAVLVDEAVVGRNRRVGSVAV